MSDNAADNVPTVPDELAEVRLTFRPGKSDVPASVRFRHLLKFALRSLGLRCVRIEPAADGRTRVDDHDGSKTAAPTEPTP